MGEPLKRARQALHVKLLRLANQVAGVTIEGRTLVGRCAIAQPAGKSLHLIDVRRLAE